ncbi:DnaJ family protein [Entamoeba marina]
MRISIHLIFILCFSFVYSLDYYKILEIPRDASEKDIKKAYRALSLKYHPDKPTGDKEKFQNINKAFEVLSDKRQREIYDHGGEEALKNNGMPHQNPNDIFEQFFSGFGFGNGGGNFGFGDGGFHFETSNFGDSKRKKPTTTQDITIEKVVTLEQIYSGGTIDVEFTRQKKCSHCGGTGAETESDFVKCPSCNGHGVKIENRGPMRSKSECTKCHGTGKIIKNKCHVCNGKGTVKKAMKVPVNLPKASKDGDVIKIPGFSNDAYGMKPGDVNVLIKIEQHPTFTRKGSDLYASISVTLLESLTGFQKSLTLLDGSQFIVGQRKITPHGSVLTYDNLGLPLTQHSSRFGNLFVTVNVMYPSSLSEKQTNELKKILI